VIFAAASCRVWTHLTHSARRCSPLTSSRTLTGIESGTIRSSASGSASLHLSTICSRIRQPR